MRYTLDADARRTAAGRVLLAGSPLRLFRLTAAGARLVDALAAGDDLATTGAAGRLLDRLVEAGAAHPKPEPHAGPLDDVTVVVPTRDRDVEATLGALGPCGPIVVVDDASAPPVTTTRPGVLVVRRTASGGPARARNEGLAHVHTPWVAFVDSDVVPRPGWLATLTSHAADDRVGAVAPRVASAPGPGPLARYETNRSPLDLGGRPARVAAGSRVSYVPAAALLCRTEAVRGIGGFDEGLATGEDVDLVWRLAEAGWGCRYEPAAVVDHAPRSTLAGFLAQRRAYGASAGPLARRHPGALAPVRANVWSAVTWAVAAAWSVPAGAAVGAVTAALAARGDVLPRPEAARLAARGHVEAGRSLAASVTRVWWPAAMVAATVSRRARLAVALAALGLPLAEWARRRPPLDPVRFTLLRLLDDGAYGWGVWQGAWHARTLAPLAPDLRLTAPWAGTRRRPHPPTGARPDRTPGAVRRETP